MLVCTAHCIDNQWGAGTSRAPARWAWRGCGCVSQPAESSSEEAKQGHEAVWKLQEHDDYYRLDAHTHDCCHSLFQDWEVILRHCHHSGRFLPAFFVGECVLRHWTCTRAVHNCQSLWAESFTQQFLCCLLHYQLLKGEDWFASLSTVFVWGYTFIVPCGIWWWAVGLEGSKGTACTRQIGR